MVSVFGSVSARMLRVACALAVGLLGASALAQSPIPLPSNITTVAGGGATSTGSAATPVACAVGSPYKSYDQYGNGCLGAQANFSTDLRGGLASDGQGNIWIADTSNSMVRKYDPKTGVISRLAGKSTNCTVAQGELDSSGDGCPSGQTSFASTPRGIATDPYGNVLWAGYGTQMVHVECLAISPLCPGTTGRKQVGYQYRVAGCVATPGATTATAATATNVAAGTEGDNSYASPYSNLPGDAGVSAGTVAGGACGNTVGILNQPRGVAADRFGNVYIGETGTTNIGLRYRVVLGPQTYAGVTNPLWAIINGASYVPLGGTASATYTAHEGYIYTLLGGFANTPAAIGGTCGAFTATDTKGDGCPFTFSSANGGQQGVAADNNGNVIFSDVANSLLRVLYAGGANATVNPMYAAIVANNPSVTPTAGNVYLLAGGGTGSTFASTTPALGSSVILSNGIFKVNVGPGGNLYLGDSSNNQALLFDVTTGYIRQLFKNGTACAAHVVGSAIGDGCAGPAGFTVTTANGFGVAPDPLGNLYVSDSTSALIRKVEATSLIPTIVGSTTAAGTPLTQTLVFHGPVGTINMTVTAVNAPSDIVVGTVSCPAPNPDNTTDCTVPVTFAPKQPGTRTANLAVSALDSNNNVLGSKVVPVSGLGLGTALVTDVAAPTVNTSGGLTPVTAAVGGAGFLYTVDTASGQVIKANPATGTNAAIGAAPANPLQISVDTFGNVYVTSNGAASITRYTLNKDASYTPVVQNTAVTLPQAVAGDASGNLYIADKSTGTVTEYAAGTSFSRYQPAQVIGSGFTNPVGLAFDGMGNLYVADQAAGVYKIANVNGVYTTTLYVAGSGATVTLANVPTGIAADAAGNVYIQDATSKSILAVPATQGGPAYTTVLAGLTVPSGVAVDGNGVVFSADSGAPAIRQVLRNQATFSFGTSTSLTFAGTITNAGNTNATGYQAAGLDTTTFPVTSVSPTNCFASTAITPGYACSITAQFSPGTGTGNVSSTVAYAPASSTTGNLLFTGVKSGAAVTTTTTIGTQTPAAPVYSVSGTEVTFPVTVTASDSSTPAGSVNVTVDSNTPVAYTLVNGTVSVSLSGLAAGSHTIVASYANQAGLTGSTSATVNFTVAQATVTVSWTPSATTQQFSAAVGAGVLDATATAGGTPVAGAFIYTATPGSGTAAPIHSATYLPIGGYALGVTFVPNDAVDFTSASGTVPSYTVTKATTIAAVGASNFVVAADGSANFTKVQDAVNAVGASGGAVYVKPGTYQGLVTVVQPNVALRGLGGDPTAVVMTNAQGAFGGAGVYMNAGEFSSSKGNGSQLPTGSSLFTGDEGSATLVVAKGINTAFSTATLTPNSFYGENFTLVNTYDSDTTTTTTTYLTSPSTGNCTANAGPARTYNDLYSASQLCASQALAIWTTSDLAVMNNVYSTSLQDTIYAGSQGSGSNGYVPARQYWFRGKVTGQVDYIFGDAAAVFDYASIYTVPKAFGMTGGTQTIEAQNKMTRTGSASDYLSGYIMNSDVFTSYTTGMTGLEFGRPYGPYSTYIMLNSYVDQVAPAGYIEFSGQTNLPTSTYAEFNDLLYTDPATGAADLNGVIYTGLGGNSGSGVTGPRETVSQNPGALSAGNAVKTSLTQAQAQQYFTSNFLGTTVPAAVSTTANWNPTAALAANVNAFVPGAALTSVGGQSVTILLRPQTPGLGAIANGNYTIPTGTYALRDTFNGATTTLVSGSLDAAGEAYYSTAGLNAGVHNLAWTYSGDANFSGSTTSNAYVLTVTGTATTTTVAATANPITYGQSATINVTVAPASGTASPNGTVVLTIDGAATQTATLSGGTASFTVSGLLAGSHSFTASYGGATMFTGSSSASAYSLTVNKATLGVFSSCANRLFDQPNVCTASASGFQYADTAATVIATGPTGTTTAQPNSPAGTYSSTAAITLTAFGQANYTVFQLNSNFTVTGNTPQRILFAPLPNFPHGGSYQLTARSTSGLPVTYTVSGNATVSGSTLTVTGTGTITVTASQSTDSTGDYAAAAPVSRSFVAP